MEFACLRASRGLMGAFISGHLIIAPMSNGLDVFTVRVKMDFKAKRNLKNNKTKHLRVK